MARAALLIVVLAAFAVRAWPRGDLVFAEGGLRLADPDCWHHLRQIEQWVRHFPHRMAFDPYLLHPAGQSVPVAPLFDGIAATIAWTLGLGSPSGATVERVAAILPAVLGALTCVPAAALGRRFGGTAGGLVAALAVAFLPGQVLARSLVGFADHHALETLLAATTLALFAAALQGDPPRRPWPAAVALGLYLLSWTGGALLVAAIAAGTLAVVAADVMRRRDPSAPALAFLRVAAVAAAVVALAGDSLPTGRVALGALAGAAAAVVVVWMLASAATRAGVRPAIAVAGALAALVVLGATAAVVVPAAQDAALAALGWFRATAQRVTVGEARPLWLADDGASLVPVWEEFGVPGVAALAGLVVVARRALRDARRDDVLLVVVLGLAAAAPFAQTRFAAGAAVAVAAFAGAALGPWLGRAWDQRTDDGPNVVGRVVWPVTAAIALVVPTSPLVARTAASPPGPGAAWREALDFLRDATPEPFGDAAAFTRLVPRDAAHERSGYGVLAWWDAGSWITGIARRVPVANPTQAGAGDAARVLLETDPERAAGRADALGARYVVIDAELPVLARGGAYRGVLPSVAPWAQRDPESLVRVLWERQRDGSAQPVVVFLPDYFRSLAVRLHTFGGVARPAADVLAVAWRDGPDGVPEISETRRFPTYADAAAWVAKRPDGRASVASTDPLVPCVPLEAAHGFRAVFLSSETMPLPGVGATARVQVWERISR